MNKFFKVLGIGAVTVALGTLASCTNDEPNSGLVPGNGSLFVKAPTITAWSGNEVFSPNGSTRAEASEPEAPASVTAEEVAAAKAYFDAKDEWRNPANGQERFIEDLSGWKSYFVQDVVNGNRFPSDKAMMWGDTNSEQVSNVAVWNMDADDVMKILNTDAYLDNDAKVEVDLSATSLVANHPLKDISFETVGYDSWNTKYETKSSGHAYQYDFAPNYKLVSFDNDEEVYVALYGYTHQNNGAWDRIIRITKTEVDTPEGVVDDEEAGEEGDVIFTEDYRHNNEVEVNLSVLDLHDAYSVEDLATKLSIHVRYPKDVRVRIPVPTELIVPADDLNIVLSHAERLEQYGMESKATYEINGQVVEVAVEFGPCVDCSGHEKGTEIVVTTKGINKEVMDYLIKNNGDGINFEIWNYYQWNVGEGENVTRQKPTTEDVNFLRWNWLDLTTVEFGYDNGTWNAYTNNADLPYYFINAINNDRDRENATGAMNEMDCYVNVIINQAVYDNFYEGTHLNGSIYNRIFIRDDIYGTAKHDLGHTDPNPQKPGSSPEPPAPGDTDAE
ncbi:MAG: hypothetical protein J1F07_07710 [Muribaculaceae bacterium]|nr:hypothetical protein [Muribaculaceae bacterium]